MKNTKITILLISILLPSFLYPMNPKASAAIAQLELFPGQGLEDVKLPREYYSPTSTEKSNMKWVQEGCFTVLEKDGDCALVGPIRPCLLIVLTNNQKVAAGHLVSNANLSSLLTGVKQEFGSCDFSQTTGTLLTVALPTYAKSSSPTSTLSFQDLCQGRSQFEELKKTKDSIIQEFNIPDRTHITAHKFIGCSYPGELGNYEDADVYTFIKYNNGNPLIYSTSPMAENIYGNFQYLPIVPRIKHIKTLRREHSKGNPYFLQFDPKHFASYGHFPFVKI